MLSKPEFSNSSKRNRLLEMVFSDILFPIVKFDAQYLSKLNRYFDKVMGDFGPHQTIQVFTFLFPFPPFNTAGCGSSHRHLLRLFPFFRLFFRALT